MPIYEYKCKRCGLRFERLHCVERRNSEYHCGARAKLLIPSRIAPPVIIEIDDKRGTKVSHKEAESIRNSYINPDGEVVNS